MKLRFRKQSAAHSVRRGLLGQSVRSIGSLLVCLLLVIFPVLMIAALFPAFTNSWLFSALTVCTLLCCGLLALFLQTELFSLCGLLRMKEDVLLEKSRYYGLLHYYRIHQNLYLKKTFGRFTCLSADEWDDLQFEELWNTSSESAS